MPGTFVLGRLDVVYRPENCRLHLFFQGSMKITAHKFAAHTCFTKARCSLRPEELSRALVSQTCPYTACGLSLRLPQIISARSSNHVPPSGSFLWSSRPLGLAWKPSRSTNSLFLHGYMPFDFQGSRHTSQNRCCWALLAATTAGPKVREAPNWRADGGLRDSQQNSKC